MIYRVKPFLQYLLLLLLLFDYNIYQNTTLHKVLKRFYTVYLKLFETFLYFYIFMLSMYNGCFRTPTVRTALYYDVLVWNHKQTLKKKKIFDYRKYNQILN